MLHNFFTKLLILFVLLSQFATMTHAVEHQFVEDEHEWCSICIHQINSNNLVTNNHDSNKFFHSNDEKIDDAHNTFYLLSLSVYCARSPPITSFNRS